MPEVPRAARDSSAVPAFVAGVAALGLVSAVVALHRPVTAAFPAAAALYRIVGVETDTGTPVVSDLKAEWGDGGVAIAGKLGNPGTARLALPDLRISVRDGAAETLYSWTAPAPQASLDPGETVGFSSRLSKLPAQGRDLAVSFAAHRMNSPEGAGKGAR